MHNNQSASTQPTASAQWIKPAMTATSLRDALSGNNGPGDGQSQSQS